MPIVEIIGSALLSALAGNSMRRLDKLAQCIKSRLSAKKVREIICVEAARTTRELIDFLLFRYEQAKTRPVSLMRRKVKNEELVLPILLFRLGPKQKEVDDLLGNLNDTSYHVLKKKDINSSNYLKMRKAIDARIEDNLMFELKHLEYQDETLKIHGGLTRYVSCLASQDELEWELLKKLSKWIGKGTSSTNWGIFSKKLSLRNKVEKIPGDWIKSEQGRCNGLAISTLIIFRDTNGTYCVMFGKRALKTAAGSDLFHVIPACMFQPELGNHKAEWSIEHNIFKEYGEELFNKKLNKRAVDPRYFYSKWECVAELRKALENQSRAQLLPTGVVMNLLNLRPEICALLLVHDADWWAMQMAKMETNWEYHPREEIFSILGKARTHYNIDSVEEQFYEDFDNNTGLWVPAGLAAFWLGVDAAREIINT